MAAQPAETPHPWKTSDPWISGILAYLIPGAGHLYQGRHFKAILYGVCILGTFFYGTLLADWKAVEVPTDFRIRQRPGYLMQVGVGLPALTAAVQTMRYEKSLERIDFERSSDMDGFLGQLKAPIDAEFRGDVGTFDLDRAEIVNVTGRVRLEPALDDLGSPVVTGTLTFEGPEGGTEELALGGRVRVRPRIYGNRRRKLKCDVVNADGVSIGLVEGSVPRGFIDWYQVPLEPEDEQVLNQRLGKRLELALVYTWVAGLLNVLAVWDCVSGPAYGIGDGSDEDEPAEAAEKGATA